MTSPNSPAAPVTFASRSNRARGELWTYPSSPTAASFFRFIAEERVLQALSFLKECPTCQRDVIVREVVEHCVLDNNLDVLEKVLKAKDFFMEGKGFHGFMDHWSRGTIDTFVRNCKAIPGGDNLTPLEKAMIKNQREVFKFIVGSSADCEERDRLANICLGKSLRRGARDECLGLLAFHPNISLKDIWEKQRFEDRTQWLRDDCIAVLRRLLDAGIRLNGDTWADDTYLTVAVREDEPKTVELLLQYGASTNKQSLDIAITWNRSTATIGALLRHACGFTGGVRLLLTKLHERCLHEEHETGILQMACRQFPDVVASDWSLLHLAVWLDLPDISCSLIERGYSLNVRCAYAFNDHSGQRKILSVTPLDISTALEESTMFHLLVEKGAKPSSNTMANNSTFMTAVAFGNHDLTHTLLQNWMLSGDGLSVLRFAAATVPRDRYVLEYRNKFFMKRVLKAVEV